MKTNQGIQQVRKGRAAHSSYDVRSSQTSNPNFSNMLEFKTPNQKQLRLSLQVRQIEKPNGDEI